MASAALVATSPRHGDAIKDFGKAASPTSRDLAIAYGAPQGTTADIEAMRTLGVKIEAANLNRAMALLVRG